MKTNQKIIVAILAAALAAVPILGYAQSAEDWLRKGKDESNPELQVEYFTQAIRLNPELADAYACRGMANSDLGRYDKAIADYTKAIDLNPENAQTYNNRGYAYEKLERHDSAIADYTRAIRLDPHYAAAYNNRGVVYYNLGRKEQALGDFDKACKFGYAKGCENYYTVK
jgi:tetratricopeptide (TPR) repeat protein